MSGLPTARRDRSDHRNGAARNGATRQPRRGKLAPMRSAPRLLALLVVLTSAIGAGCRTVPEGEASRSPPPVDEWSLATPDGCRLYVREVGEGPRVVALHGGWGAEHGYLVEGLAPLAARSRVVFYDQRGSLRSLCPATAAVTVDRHVEDLELLRETLGEERLVLLGHSMGGFLAMSYAARHPERVAGLVLVASPAARWNVEAFRDVERAALERLRREDVVATLRAHGLDVDRDPAWDARRRSLWHRITWAAINLYDVRRWRALGGAFFHRGEAGAAAAASMPESWDFTDALRRLDVPILVVHGDDDFLPAAAHDGWLASVPNARLVAIPEAVSAPA